MYISKLDGQSPDDGIYILIKNHPDNAMDEYFMGFGKEIHQIQDEKVIIRDFGRGIPLGKAIDCVSNQYRRKTRF